MYTFFTLLLDALLPRRCVGCRGYDAWVCDACLTSAIHVRHRDASAESRTAYGVEKISTLGPYGNPVWRKTIQLLKFQRVRDVADLCGAQMAQYLVDSQVYTPANAVLIPIPLHPARQRERGFNQAELLAQVMHRRTGIPMVTQALVRTVHAASQTGFSVAERQQRMHGMFRVTQRASVINGKHVLLIDDVVTTGATAGAAAAALVTAGPKTIHIVAVAHGG